jgi:hypothetical protein
LNFNAPEISVLSQRFQLFGWAMVDRLRWRDAGAWPSAARGTQLPDDADNYRQDDK